MLAGLQAGRVRERIIRSDQATERAKIEVSRMMAVALIGDEASLPMVLGGS